MSWARFDDRFPRHRRVRMLTTNAKWLHVVAICHCAEHLTDGLVDEIAFGQIVADSDLSKTVAAKCIPVLTQAGLWIPHDGRGGWIIRDYLDYNPTRDEVKAKREARAAAGRLGGLRSGEARAKQMLRVSFAHCRSKLEPHPTKIKDQVLLGALVYG